MDTQNVRDPAALIDAAKRFDVQAIRELVESGADVNGKDEDGWTALMWASGYTALDAVKALIEAGADVNLTDKRGKSALMLAARGPIAADTVSIIKALLNAKANVRAADSDGNTALSYAGSAGHSDAVYALRDADA